MKLLLDTHLLILMASQPDKLSKRALQLVSDNDNELLFSVVSVWEISIKYAKGRLNVNVPPSALRQGLLRNGYREVAITGEHALAVGGLAPLHKDPVDRLLIVQSQVESALLLTSDWLVAQYPGAIELV